MTKHRYPLVRLIHCRPIQGRDGLRVSFRESEDDRPSAVFPGKLTFFQKKLHGNRTPKIIYIDRNVQNIHID